MESFDVYDSNRKSLGYTKIRGEKLLDNEYNQGVELWIFNNNKLLIDQRSKEKSHALEWEVPGGCSQVGETSIDTLFREAKEEIGLESNSFEFLDTVIYKHQFVDIYKTNMKADLSKVKLQEEEVSDIKFVTKKEFLEMNNNGEIVQSVFNRYEVIKDKINW